jgi:hypothetical protein
MQAASRARLAPADVLEIVDQVLTQPVDRGTVYGSEQRFATALFALLDAPADCLRMASAATFLRWCEEPAGRPRSSG